MHIGFYSHHKNDTLLTSPGAAIGDDLNYPFVLMAQKLQALGHKTSVINPANPGSYDAVIFIEFPGTNNPYFKQILAAGFTSMYLLLLESPAIKPDNYDVKNHRYFKKIFTWSDPLVDDQKYFKIQYAHQIPAQFDFNLAKKQKLCALISSNKSTASANELYSERVNAIRWFEANHPDDFDLYGKGWDRYRFEGTFLGINIARLNRLTFLTRLLKPHYPSYKGPIAKKQDVLAKYKFSICYENIKDVPGYITEKIFDCLLAGCVPVYLGANNITDHIPANTFIDKRNFTTYEELYTHMKNMPDQTYLGYLENIKTFLTGQKARPFSAEYFAETIINQIIS